MHRRSPVDPYKTPTPRRSLDLVLSIGHPSLGTSIDLALDADTPVVTWAPAFDEVLAGPYALTLAGETLEATVYVQTVVDHFASPALGRQAGRPCPL